MSKFFINRPIVAIVIAILTVIVGAVAVVGLPVAQFPQIAPPEVQVSAIYVGADAPTIEQSVATPIEQQMSGVDNMNYMYSLNSTANGQMRLIVNFDVATDPNTDLILAQSRVTQASSQLPGDVNNYGVTVQKSVLAPLMLVALNSPKSTYDARFLANYAYINLVDQLTRVKGVGTVQVFGAGQYAMRLWVKPDQLAKLAITVPEIVSAMQTQNTVNPAGQVGSEPIPAGQPFTYSVRAQGRLSSPEEFQEIVIRETPDTGIVRVKDVARVELGSQDYSVTGHLDGNPSAIVAVYQLPGSNAVDTAAGVRKLLSEAKQRFPGDMDFSIPVDTTRAVHEGIKEIVETLLIAIVLVVAVVYLFLQGWRSTLIPLLAVPVSLIGTFVFFPLFGFSINTLSLFGLVLAIGLVVDDAIVVVEAVERHIEEGLTPKEAALKAMQEISGPVVGIALVLSAVFVPTAFIPGITGRLYQQYAVTIAISAILSAFNALSLSPALAALILKPKAEGKKGPLAHLSGPAKWRRMNSQEAKMETEAIAEVLGGRKVLGRAIRKPDDLAQLVRDGLPASSVTVLASKLHLGNSVLSRKLGIPQRTLTRRLSQGSLLTSAESDRTVRMARVYANAVEMIGDQEKAIEWLRTPNRALGGERPLDQLDTDMGARMVEDILGRIAFGVYS